MEKILIEGSHPLQGEVEVCGAKNAALPILFATILTDERCVIRKVPRLTDVTTTLKILSDLGMGCERLADGAIAVELVDSKPFTAPYESVSEMRASVCALGPLLARRKRAKVSMPGGCSFGVRPIDLHLKGLRALGAEIRKEHGYIEAEARELRGANIHLAGPNGPTVLGTANVMMAATLAKGITVIDGAACEPEIADLAFFLNAMGARIEGIGTTRLRITGVRELGGTEHTIIPDRIEAGTFLIAGALTRGDVVVRGVRADHMTAVLDVLRQVGVRLSLEADSVRVSTNGAFKPVNLTTLPYPGFPTDLQAQVMALLSVAEGISVISETIYPERFFHVAELVRLGANIRKQGTSALINGVKKLSGAQVMASDLRASAGLVLAGLVAAGTTEVGEIQHLDRGYERLEHRMSDLGAHIYRETAAGDAPLKGGAVARTVPGRVPGWIPAFPADRWGRWEAYAE